MENMETRPRMKRLTTNPSDGGYVAATLFVHGYVGGKRFLQLVSRYIHFDCSGEQTDRQTAVYVKPPKFVTPLSPSNHQVPYPSLEKLLPSPYQAGQCGLLSAAESRWGMGINEERHKIGVRGIEHKIRSSPTFLAPRNGQDFLLANCVYLSLVEITVS